MEGICLEPASWDILPVSPGVLTCCPTRWIIAMGRIRCEALAEMGASHGGGLTPSCAGRRAPSSAASRLPLSASVLSS